MSADNVIKFKKTVLYHIERLSETPGVWEQWSSSTTRKDWEIDNLKWCRKHDPLHEYRLVESENVLTERVINEQ